MKIAFLDLIAEWCEQEGFEISKLRDGSISFRLDSCKRDYKGRANYFYVSIMESGVVDVSFLDCCCDYVKLDFGDPSYFDDLRETLERWRNKVWYI